MNTLDYPDIALHAAIAILILANGSFWIWREYQQHKDKPWKIFTSFQSLLEWIIPAIGIPFMAYILYSYALS